MSRGPDFIIIGAMKCATSTLHEQLAGQRGVFMSTPKEPNFFSDDDQWAQGIDWYRSLFADVAKHDLCGESSTHYTKLPTHAGTIERMQQHLKATRFIYVMRHPIDRLVSQYIHEWTQGRTSAGIDDAIESLPELISYSQYAYQLEPYVEAFGREQVLPVFYERLVSKPQLEFERISRFIGYVGPPEWKESVGAQNVSSRRMRRSSFRDTVLGLPGARRLRRLLIPQAWRDRVKRRYMMTERPELSTARRERLESIFDGDLARLGSWLGLPLNCGSFAEIARSTPDPTWRDDQLEAAA